MPKAMGASTEYDKWQRLSPAAIIHFVIKFFYQLFTQGLQGLLPLAAVAFTAGENRWFILGLILVGGALMLLFMAVLSYLKFRYRLTTDSVLIQSGVFTRKRLILQFGRIQNVALKEPLYFRPLKLVTLSLESAGSAAEEVSLAGVPRSLAENIRRTILNTPNTQSKNVTDPEQKLNPDDTTPESLLRQPVSELIRYGLSNNNIWVFAGISAGFVSQLDWDNWRYIKTAEQMFQTTTHGDSILISLLVTAGLMIITTALLGASALGAVILHYDFHLTRHGKQLNRTKGLFERQDTSLPETKIQCIKASQPWPAKLLQRFHLTLKQVGFAKAGNVAPTGKTFLIPSATEAFTHKFSALLYPDFDWHTDRLKQISPAYTRKIILWLFLPIVSVPAVMLAYFISPLGLLLLLIPFLLWPIVAQRQRMYGYYKDTTHGLVRNGFIGQTLTIFPFHKIQAVKIHRSPGQIRKNLASLTIKLAGTSLTVPYMPLKDAEDWRDTMLFCAESSQKSWM